MYVNPVMLQLPNALRKRGATVFLVDGWGSRGAGGYGMAAKIYGPILHWIVSTLKGQARRQSLGLIINGRPGLSGPLANLYLDFDGACGVVAAGRANHGGAGSWRGVSGNQFWIGIEAEGPPFTAAQIEAYARILAAIYDVTGQHPRDWSPSHQEYAPSRKVDIGDYIYTIRSRAIYLVDHKIFANTQEDDMTPEQERQLKFVFDAIRNGGADMPDNGRSLGQSVANIADVMYEGGTGTPKDATLYQRVVRMEAALAAIADRLGKQ